MGWLIADPKNVRNPDSVMQHEGWGGYYSANQTWVGDPKIYPDKPEDGEEKLEVDMDLEYLNNANPGLNLKKYPIRG